MEFQCLWLTTPAQFKSWKALLANFPFPLQHLDYKSQLDKLSEQAPVNSIAVCIWSEEELYQTPDRLRKLLSKTKKPSLLLVNEERFAHKAFELGFKFCIHKSDVRKTLFSTLSDMLTPYFSPQNKSDFLLDKLWFTDTHPEEGIHFIPLDTLVLIQLEKQQVKVLSTLGNFSSRFPFSWLKVQCKLRPEFLSLNPRLLINTNEIRSLTTKSRGGFELILNNNSRLALSALEGKLLTLFLNPNS